MLMLKWNKVGAMFASAALTIATWLAFDVTSALAIGQPSPGQMGLSEPATEVMSRITGFYDLVNIIIIGITIFVLALMVYVVLRFNERANPKPSKTTHNVALEVAWTVIPIAILVVIAIPSFKLLNLQYDYPKPDVTIKTTGHAWYWEYEYLDQKGVTIEANMIGDEDVIKAEIGDKEFASKFGKLEDGSIEKVKALYAAAAPIWAKRSATGQEARQLAVDNEVAVPVGKVVHLLVTSGDVIHSWTIPAFGAKMQAVPGRIHATWFQPTKTGMYYGQCSVLCGKNHSGMPIAVRVVTEQGYKDWITAMGAKDTKKAKAILKAEAALPQTTAVASAAGTTTK
jgi:cytochrome c oxidase subunit II